MLAELSKDVLSSHPATEQKTYFSSIVFDISEQLLLNVNKMPIEYRPFAQTQPKAKTFEELMRGYMNDLQAIEVVQRVKEQHPLISTLYPQ